MHILTGLKYVCISSDAPVYGCVVTVTALIWEPAEANKCRVRFVCDQEERHRGWAFTTDRDRFEHDFMIHPADPIVVKASGYSAERISGL